MNTIYQTIITKDNCGMSSEHNIMIRTHEDFFALGFGMESLVVEAGVSGEVIICSVMDRIIQPLFLSDSESGFDGPEWAIIRVE